MSIDVTRAAGIATVTVNAPERLNALNSDLLVELEAAFSSIAKDETTRVVIFTGAGERAFVAGANIKEMAGKSRDEALEFARLGHAVASRIEQLPQPVIAAVNGFALGGGCELALACDIRHCSENAVFAQPEVQLGIPPGWGGSQRLERAIGPGYAAEMIYTGKRIDAAEALRIGLVNAVHPPESLLDEVGRLASSIAECSPSAVRASKRLMALTRGANAAGALAEEVRTFADQFAGDEQKEGMHAFLEKRTPSFAQSAQEE
ncbi:MAG TPA: enoyl-CoA hydratase-related protein, partial [Thermomicrobiales bacterium]|nr:enoyl-CoA hydratase-related protein [Thermomicrobiales bacterium]